MLFIDFCLMSTAKSGTVCTYPNVTGIEINDS